jgi:SAM-dependent methyltransferase
MQTPPKIKGGELATPSSSIIKKRVTANLTKSINMTSSNPAYENPAQALEATDRFYEHADGFQYPLEYVVNWLTQNVALPQTGRVLDLCCGDGIWSKGMKEIRPGLEIFGIDISLGGISKAGRLLSVDDSHFVVGDAETELPWRDGFFDVIFSRGPGLYNQHCMDRPATIAVIEMWHRKLSKKGRFYSIFSSQPEAMGTYTPIEKVKLPYNRASRQTDAVDFRGGKFHHSIQSFLTPFWKAQNVAFVQYSFFNNHHVLITRKVRS